MTQKSTQFKLVSLSLLVLALLSFLTVGFIQIRRESRETALLLSLSEQSEKEVVLARSVRLVRESARSDIEAFEALVLSDEKLVSVIESVEEAGRMLGLKVEIVSVAKIGETQGGGQERVKIVVESSGPWRGSFSFLKAIENLPYRALVEESSLIKAGSSWRSRVSLTLSTFN